MKEYKLTFTNGGSYSGGNAAAVVDALRFASPFTETQSRMQYMLGYASRYRKFHKMAMKPFYSAETFLLSVAETQDIKSFIIREKEKTNAR